MLAQQQADALNGNALKSLREMSAAVTHAVWFFANTRNVLPPRATSAKAARADGRRGGVRGDSPPSPSRMTAT